MTFSFHSALSTLHSPLCTLTFPLTPTLSPQGATRPGQAGERENGLPLRNRLHSGQTSLRAPSQECERDCSMVPTRRWHAGRETSAPGPTWLLSPHAICGWQKPLTQGRGRVRGSHRNTERPTSNTEHRRDGFEESRSPAAWLLLHDSKVKSCCWHDSDFDVGCSAFGVRCSIPQIFRQALR